MRVSLFLTHACNLRCAYCYNGRKFGRAMSLDVARKGVELAFSGRASPRVSFFGGEPLLEMDRIRAITAMALEEGQRRGVRPGFLVVTNGTLLTDPIFAFLQEHRFYLGISLDGCRQAHEANRPCATGESSYDGVVAAVRRAVAARNGAGLRVIAVANPASIAWWPDSLGALLDLGVRNISMNLDYEGVWDEPARDRFLVALRALGDRYVGAYRAADGEGQDARFRLNLLDSRILTRLKRGYTPRDRCDFGCEEVAVSPTGRLYPCDRLVGEDTRDDVVIGHVDTGIDAARRDALVAEKNGLQPDCAACALQPRCMHWCGCVNHAMTGRVGEVSGLLCWFEQRLIEEADRCASILFQEGNRAFVRRFYAPRSAPSGDGGWDE